jgi:hypothetical protein
LDWIHPGLDFAASHCSQLVLELQVLELLLVLELLAADRLLAELPDSGHPGLDLPYTLLSPE